MTNLIAPHAISLRALTKCYGDVRAVDGVDLDVSPGEVVALLGPNGAGKSTTIDMLLGLTSPDAGEVQAFGVSPRQAIATGRVGAMLQSGELLPDVTVHETISMVSSLHQHPLAVDDALDRAGIADLAKRRTSKLSSGQRQRLRFAMAIVPDPDLIVLDEPSAGMDVESRIGFWATMREQVRAGRTILFATHYLQEADRYADRIVLLRSGRIVADGSAGEIKAVSTGRTITFSLPSAAASSLLGLPGVDDVEVRGNTVVLHCSDSDAALRALLATEPAARHIEVAGADLTEAFLALTTGAQS